MTARITVHLPPAVRRGIAAHHRSTSEAVVAVRVDAVDADAAPQPHAVRHLPMGVDVAAELRANVVPAPVRPLVEVDVALSIEPGRRAPLILHPGPLPLVRDSRLEAEVVDLEAGREHLEADVAERASAGALVERQTGGVTLEARRVRIHEP